MSNNIIQLKLTNEFLRFGINQSLRFFGHDGIALHGVIK